MIRPSWIVAAMLCALPGIATADIFMHIARASGDSTAKGHENWIRVSSVDWNVEALSSWTAGGGASVGKPMPGEIQLVLPTGPWSAHFLKMITSGKAEPKVILDAIASDGRVLVTPVVWDVVAGTVTPGL